MTKNDPAASVPLELAFVEDADGVFRPDETPPAAAAAPAPGTAVVPAGPVTTEVTVSPGGGLTVTGDGPRAVSTVPQERMAADGWHDVFEQLRRDEEGRGGGNGVYVTPGGGLHVQPLEGGDARPVSKVPEVRMAATVAEAEELRALDPHNVEGWTPVQSGPIDGWRFRLRDPLRPDRHFVFLTFRNPSRRNQWDISPILPVMDDAFGHDPHMIRTTIGGQSIPIICGPAGEPAPSLTAVRGVAAKWMAYTAAKLAGVQPGFSL